jgi:hypothetical protein
MLDQIEHVSKNPEIDVKYLYFNLEEVEERLELKILSKFLYNETGLEYSVQDLSNLTGESKLLNKMHLLDKTQKLVDTFSDKVTIISDCKKPSEIKTRIEAHVQNCKDKMFSKDFYFIIVIDNLKFLNRDHNHKDQKEAIDYLCLNVLQEYRTKYSAIPIVIQHLNRSSEVVQKDWKQNIILDSVLPTTASLGESTYTQDPATHIISIFSPFKYGIKEYLGYDVETWKDNIRITGILKSRDGGSGLETAFFFNGKVSVFQELEPPEFFQKNGYSSYGLQNPTKNTTKKTSWKDELDLQ